MPRLSHTLDLDPVDREDIAHTVSAAHEILRSARFDDTGELILPDQEEIDRLEARAEELGLILTEDERRERALQDEELLADVRSDEGLAEPLGSTEREMRAQDLADEAAVREAIPALSLVSGEHLAPGSHYLLNEVDEEGVPLFAGSGEGWVGTDLTVTAWDENGVCSFDFVMRDDVGGEEPPETSGSVVHDRAADTLTVHADLRFQSRGPLARWGANLLKAEVTARIDLRAWFAAADGGTVEPPVTLDVEHRLVRAQALGSVVPGPDGKWSVTGVLDVRGRGLARPLVAVTAWALLRSIRRADEKSVDERAADIARDWNDNVRVLPELPGFLSELAEALTKAEPRSHS